VNALNVRALDISGNRFYCPDAATSEPILKLFRGVDDVRIAGNYFYRDGTSFGDLITITSSGGVSPRGVLIDGNIGHQFTSDSVDITALINCTDVSDLTITNNILYYHNAATATDQGIKVSGNIGDTRNITITNNKVIGNEGGGTLLYGIVVAPDTTRTMTGLNIADNQIQGCSAGVRFNNSGTYANYPYLSNNFSTSVTTHQSYGAGITTNVIGGQHGAVAIYRTEGTPESAIAAPIGSLALQSTGGAGTTLYVKESGTSTTGWVASGAARDRGSCYVSTPASTTLAAATAAKASGTTTAGTLGNFTMPADNRLTYTGTATRDFLVSASISAAKAAGTTSLVELHIAKNGTVVTGANVRLQVAATDEFQMSLVWPVSLATNDYVEIFLKDDTGDDITVNRGTLVANAE
jgi:hypothetical protein